MSFSFTQVVQENHHLQNEVRKANNRLASATRFHKRVQLSQQRQIDLMRTVLQNRAPSGNTPPIITRVLTNLSGVQQMRVQLQQLDDVLNALRISVDTIEEEQYRAAETAQQSQTTRESTDEGETTPSPSP